MVPPQLRTSNVPTKLAYSSLHWVAWSILEFARQGEFLLCSKHLLKGAAEVALNCAHRVTTLCSFEWSFQACLFLHLGPASMIGSSAPIERAPPLNSMYDHSWCALWEQGANMAVGPFSSIVGALRARRAPDRSRSTLPSVRVPRAGGRPDCPSHPFDPTVSFRLCLAAVFSTRLGRWPAWW